MKGDRFRVLGVLLALCGLAPIPVLQDAYSRVKPAGTFGPWNNQLWIGESVDGVNFGPLRTFATGASSGSLVRDSRGRLLCAYQSTFEPSGVGIRFSLDEGRSWSEARVPRFTEMGRDRRIHTVHSLALLDDGRVRLYLTDSYAEVGRAEVRSAISHDGVSYEIEPGVRFAVPGVRLLDGAVTRSGKTWHYIAPDIKQDGKGFHAESADGLKFRRLPDVEMHGKRAWFGSAVALPRGIRFYGTGPQSAWAAESFDGRSWTLNPSVNVPGHDPSVLKVREGRWIIITTGPKDLIRTVIPDAPPPPPFP